MSSAKVAPKIARKSVRFELLLTPIEFDNFNGAAVARGMSLSAYTRESLRNQALRDASRIIAATHALRSANHRCTCVPSFGGIIAADCPVHDDAQKAG